MTAGRGTIYNPPGRDRLRYRIGTFDTFLADLLRQLPLQEIPDGELAGTRPLERVDRRPAGNWIFALLEAWATVGDVFTFYQERIANEGYLRTAVEEVSVYELIRLLGFPPRPAVAAAAFLAFEAASGQRMPEVVTVPRGARVQSVPAGGQLPQTWETSDVLSARAEWNRLQPAVATRTVRPPIRGGATALELAGAQTSLKPGAALLVMGALAGVGPLRSLRTANRVKVAKGGSAGAVSGGAAAPTTRVSWKGALDPDPDHRQAELEAPRVFVLRQEARLFGYNATPWDQLPLSTQRQQQPILGGVLLSSDGGACWPPANDGLPAKPVNVLCSAPGAGLLAGTQQGLFRLAGGSWQALTEGLGSADVRSLASGEEGHLFAGTGDGRVLRSTDGGDSWEALSASPPSPPLARLLRRLLGWVLAILQRAKLEIPSPPRKVRLPKTAVSSLLVVPGRGASRILAGTANGVFAIGAQGSGWFALNQGFPGTDPKTGMASLPVHALAVDDRRRGGSVYAGTDQGVFEAGAAGTAWRPANAGLPGVDPGTGLTKTKVLSLLALRDQRDRALYLYAGTDQGIFRRAGGRGPWRAVNNGLPGSDPRAHTAAVEVSALAVSTDAVTLTTDLFAGTDQGLFRSRDLGGGWIAVDTGQPEAKVEALTGGGALALAVPFDGFATEEWPGFSILDGATGRTATIDLSTVVQGVVAGGWVALTQAGDKGSLEVILRIRDVATVRRQGFGLSALVTRLEVSSVADLGLFDRRRTVVLIQSEGLELASAEVQVLAPLDPRSFALAAALDEPLPVQRSLILTGKPIRARFAPAAFPLTLRSREDRGQALELARTDAVQVLAPPLAEGADLVLWVRTAGGAEGVVRVAADQVVWRPAEDGDETTGQVTEVAGFEPAGPGAPGPRLIVSPPLVAAFDPQTVAIYANAARVTQGESGAQVLGSGDAAQGNQSFALSRPPLTYLPAANAAGMQSTLAVQVTGVEWQQVDSFVDAGRRDRVYVVHQDLQGNPLVTFGDGVQGARLPTGVQNVAASYRSGAWNDEVAVGMLSLLRTRPLGLKSATNPLPAPGGTPAETLPEMERRAPRATRPLGRIVSETDFEHFVLTFPGIVRARLATLAGDRGPVLAVTAAGIDGRPVAPGSDLYQQLTAAVAAVRVPGPQVRIESYRRALFDLEARVWSDPAATLPTVEQRVRDALAERFSFANSQFGDVITSSEIVILVQQVSGVAAVEIDAFYRSGSQPARHGELRAREARWSRSRKRVVPAELLLINDPDGIRLELTRA